VDVVPHRREVRLLDHLPDALNVVGQSREVSLVRVAAILGRLGNPRKPTRFFLLFLVVYLSAALAHWSSNGFNYS